MLILTVGKCFVRFVAIASSNTRVYMAHLEESLVNAGYSGGVVNTQAC